MARLAEGSCELGRFSQLTVRSYLLPIIRQFGLSLLTSSYYGSLAAKSSYSKYHSILTV